MTTPRCPRPRTIALLGLALVSLAGCAGVPTAYPSRANAAAGAPPAATCYAGVYTCVLPAVVPAGSVCTCPGLGAPSYGTAQ